MKRNLFLFALIAGCFFSHSTAQITAFAKGKEIKAGTSLNKEDLSSLEVSFKSPKLPSFIYGRSYLTVVINDAKDESVEYWTIKKNGSAAVEDFLKNTAVKKRFKVFDGDMYAGGNTLDWVFKSSPGKEARKTVKVKVILIYQEQTGYEEYGQVINLLEPLTFNVPLWDAKKMFLPFLDLTIDKTTITGDFDLHQNGPIDRASTELGHQMMDNNKNHYRVVPKTHQEYDKYCMIFV